MRLYDTARQEVVPFEPGPVVTMYTCGITPYDSTHLGHAATYLTYDVLQRRLARPRPRDPVRAQRHRRRRLDPRARPASSASTTSTSPPPRWRASTPTWRRSTCCPCCSEPRATSAIPDIRGFIGMVLDRGHAYQAGGAVYFDVSTFPRFGQVSHYDRERDARARRRARRQPRRPAQARPARLRAVAAVAPTTSRRGSRCGARAGPGWHIECSALALRELGTTIDLHGGGTDLIFPHHECERGPVRGGHRRAVRAPLDAPGDGPHGRREDVEVARQPRVRRATCCKEWDPRGHPPRRSSSTTTATRGSGTTTLHAARPPTGSSAGGRAGDGRRRALDEVRAALDDDLDTPRRGRRHRRRRGRGRGRRRRPRRCSASTSLSELRGRAHGRPTACVATTGRSSASTGSCTTDRASAVARSPRRSGVAAGRLDGRRARARARRRAGDPLPEPHLGPRLVLPAAGAAAAHHASSARPSTWTLEDEVPLPGAWA